MQVIAIGGEVIAAGIYVQYWWPNIPLWLPVTLFWLLVLAVNAAAVKMFGEFEYWFAMIKVTACRADVLTGLTRDRPTRSARGSAEAGCLVLTAAMVSPAGRMRGGHIGDTRRRG